MSDNLFKSAPLLKDAVREMGYKVCELTDYGVFYFDTPKRRHYIYLTQSSLNSDLAAKCAKDKNVTHKILESKQINTVPYLFTLSWSEAEDFLMKYLKIVRKPVFGMRSVGVDIICSKETLHNKPLEGQILEQYIQADEYRYMVINDRVVGVRKKSLQVREKNFYENIDPKDWDIELQAEALQTTKVMELKFSAIDFLVNNDGHWVLEVNSSPGIWTYEHPNVGKPIPMAKIYIEAILNSKN